MRSTAPIAQTARVLAGCALAGLLGLGLLGCAGSSGDDAPQLPPGAVTLPAAQLTPNASAPASSSSKPDSQGCANVTASLRPQGPLPAPGDMPAGTFMRTIQQRGRLIAGVDQNSLLLSYLNPFDDQIEGFDVAMLREVARAIFGNPNAIEFKAISSAQRIPAIQSQSVDIVADAMTINCERARQVAFTTVYFEAGQRILVPSNSPVRSVRDLAGRRVCATEGSTSLENIRRLAPRAIPYPVPLRTDCMVALQEGKVEAISTDDSILEGFRAQDPYSKIVGERISIEPYGMAINKDHPEFVRFVNGVLASMRADGRWEAVYRSWLGRVTGAPALAPPQARYRD